MPLSLTLNKHIDAHFGDKEVLPMHRPPAAPLEVGQPTSPVPAIRLGEGTGGPCAACEEPIAWKKPLEACAYPSAQVLHCHGLCYQYWQEEGQASRGGGRLTTPVRSGQQSWRRAHLMAEV